MPSKMEHPNLLTLELKDTDLDGNDIRTQIRSKLGFVVETASVSKLLLDLGGVSFLDSETMGQLIMLKKKCDQKQILLAICNISPPNMKVLKLVRIDELMDLYEDKSEAINNLAVAQVPLASDPLSDSEKTELHNQANAGDVKAMYEIGKRHADGDGLPQDIDLAVTWYRKAADCNYLDALFSLATCYAFGQGVSQDYGQAIPWYQKAAEQGHPDSQYMLAMSHQYGLNDTQDMSTARNWYEKAAAQGHYKSELALREMK